MNDADTKMNTELDRLLSGGGLSAIEEENVLHNVLVAVRQEKEELAAAAQPAQTPAAPPAAGWLSKINLWLSFPVAAAAAAAVLFVAWPDAEAGGAMQGDVRARGGEQVQTQVTFQLRAECAAPCRAGSDVNVAARPPKGGYLSAAALGPDETLVWLFVSEKAAMGESFGYQATLPADLAPGVYDVVLLHAEAPAGEDRGALLERLTRHVSSTGGADKLPHVELRVER